MQIIYLLSDPRDGAPRYVGVTDNLERRIKRHLKDKHEGYKRNWLQSLKLLNLTPLVEVLEIVEDKDRNISEIAWILGFRIAGYDLTNATMGGEGIICPSIETRAKMRVSQLGRKHPPETKEKIRLALTGKQNALGHKNALGYKHAPETKEKLREAHLGRVVTPETREKLRVVSLGNKSFSGRKHSPETKAKMSRAQLGRVATLETRKNMSVAAKRRRVNENKTKRAQD